MNKRKSKPCPARNTSLKNSLNSFRTLVLLCSILAGTAVQAQLPDTDQYQFLPDTSGFLGIDRNGNTIDLSNEQYIIPAGSYSVNSTVISLPFSVYFFGNTYTSFVANVNGCVVLTPSASVAFTPTIANNYTSVNSQYALLAPFWDVLSTPANYGVRYVVSGNAPYRSLTVEWFVKAQQQTAAMDYDMQFQMRLYETTNIVEYVYGRMKIGNALSQPVTASIGFSTSSASRDGAFVSLMNTDSLYVTRLRSDLVASQSLINSSEPGEIKGLHSTTEGARRRIAFVPNPIMLPGNLTAFNITANEALLYWDDNSNDEVGFRTYRVKPDELESDTSLDQNISFRTLTGLLPATTYQYRVQSYNFYTSAYSNVVTFHTGDADTAIAKASGNWSDTATWGGIVPTRNSLVIIPAGNTVVVDVAQAACHFLTVQGTLTFADNAVAKKLNVNYDVINTGRIVVNGAPTFNSIANEIAVGRSVINNGVLDLYRTSGSYTSAVTLRFTGDEDAVLTGNGDTTDLYGMILNKKSKNDSLTLNPLNLTVKNAATDAVSAGSLLNGAIHTGVLYISGTFTLENRLLSSMVFDTETGKGFTVIADNPNLTIRPLAGDITLKANCALILKRGVTDIRGSFLLSQFSLLKVEDGLLTISNQLKNLASNHNMIFIQTGGRIVTNGVVMDAPSNLLNLLDGILISNGNTKLFGDITVSRFGKHITQFGLSNGQAVKQFNVSGSFAGVLIDSLVNTPAVVKLILDAPMTVSSRLYIGNNDTIDMGIYPLTIYADSITVDGTIKGSANGRLVFASFNNQQVAGSGLVKTGTLELAKPDQGTQLILNTANPLELTNLNLYGGRIINSRKLSMGAAGANAITRIARDGTTSLGGTLDTFPVYAAGTNAYIYYNNEPVQRTTAYEIPANRKVAGLFFNNESNVAVAGGNIEVTDTLVLAAGIINTDTGNYVIFSDTTNDRALYTAAGVYFNGPFARKIPVASSAGKAYQFPVGATVNKTITISDLNVQHAAVLLRAWYNDAAIAGQAAAGVVNLDSNGAWQLGVTENTGNLKGFRAGVYENNLTPLTQFVLAKSNSPVLRTADIFMRAGERVNYYTDSLRSVTIDPSATLDTFYYFTRAELKPDTFTKAIYTIGQGKDFETLGEVAKVLGITYLDSSVAFEITQDYNTDLEVFPVAFERLLYTGSTYEKRVTIRLANNVTGVVTSNLSRPVLSGHALINFYGADDIELNGMGYDGLGLPTGNNEWTLRTGTNTLQTPVLRFVNDASRNAIRNTNIIGNNNGTASATIVFDALAKEVSGNDSNMLTGNLITSESVSSLSYAHITSKSVAGTVRNDANMLVNNRIADFQGMGINVTAGACGSAWKVEENHFYQTFSSANNVIAVNFIPGTGSGANSFKANMIGGTALNASGTPWTYSGTAIQSLLVFNTDANEETVVADNTIKNYSQTNTGTAAGLRAITATGGNIRIRANRISSSDAAALINIAGRGVSTMIYSSAAAGNISITDNIINNINQPAGTASTTNKLRGVSLEGAAPASVINNTITNFTARGSLSTYQDPSLSGIVVLGASPSVSISGNTLNNLNMAATGSVTGIAINSNSAGDISNNNIYNLTNASTATTRNIIGVSVETGSWNVINNKIVLTNAGYNTQAINIQGIRVQSSAAYKNRILHNTVYIGGTTSATSVTTAGSYPFFSSMSNADLTLQNNLFINTRGSATNIHMAGYFVYSNAYKSDFNVFYSPNPAAAIAVSGATSSFSAFRAANNTDSNSVYGKLPVFEGLPDNIMPADSALNCFIKGTGTALTSVPKDFNGIVRHALQPDMGADEFAYMAGRPSVPVFTGGNDTLCAGAPRTLLVQHPAPGYDVEWFSAPSGGTPLFTGVDFTTENINNDTVFYAQLTSGDCNSYRIPVTVKVKPAPALQITEAPASAVCGGNTLTLKAKAGIGSAIAWYSDSVGGNAIANGEQLLTGILNNDTIFYAEASNGICPSMRIAVPVTIDNNINVQPPATDTLVHVCEGFGLSLRASGPYNINWYAEAGGAAISTDSIFTLPVIPNDTFFYVASTNGSCVSNKIKVTVKTDVMPHQQPLDASVSVCGSNAFSIKADVQNGMLSWFDNDSTAVPFFTGNELFMPGLGTDTILYYEVSNGSCASLGRQQVALMPVLVAEPLAETTSAICKNTPVTLNILNVVNETVNWYTSSSSVVPVYSGSSFATGALAQDSTFYVQFEENGCVGLRIPVTVDVVESAPAPSLVSADSVCKGSTAKIMVNSPAQVNWYASATAVNVLSNDAEFTTGIITSDTIFYAASVYGSCMSERIAVKINIKGAPQPPLFIPVQSVCSGTSVKLEVTATDSVKWYATVNSTNPLNRGNVFNTPKLTGNITYYLETDNGSCRSKRVAMAIPVQAAPQMPVIDELNYRTCFNEPLLLKAKSTATINWYASATGSVLLQRDSVYITERLVADTVFYAESFDGACRSERVAVPVTVLNYIGNFQLTLPDSAIMGEEVSISSTGPQSSIYSWQFGTGASLSGATGQGPFKVTYSTAGEKDIKVLITRRSGTLNCDTLIIKHLNVVDTTTHTGLQERNGFASFSVYPNPANDVLHIVCQPKKAGKVNVQVCDITGRVVWESTGEQLPEYREDVDVSSFQSGLYLVRVMSSDALQTKKVIIE
jgi:hypothetical protein